MKSHCQRKHEERGPGDAWVRVGPLPSSSLPAPFKALRVKVALEIGYYRLCDRRLVSICAKVSSLVYNTAYLNPHAISAGMSTFFTDYWHACFIFLGLVAGKYPQFKMHFYLIVISLSMQSQPQTSILTQYLSKHIAVNLNLNLCKT